MNEDIFATIAICIIIGVVIINSIVFYNIGKNEGAIEVYRGNTTLEYTIVDSVVVDSCVVFK